MFNYTLQLTTEQKEQFLTFYKKYKTTNNNPYVLEKFIYKKITITLYKSLKVVFQGIDAQVINQLLKKWKPKNNIDYQFNIIGTDETGVGDLFGPLIVTACYLQEKDLSLIKTLKIQDSKTLSKIQINSIAQQLIKQIEYTTITINNRQYNKLYDTYANSNILKTIGHHQVIRKMAKKVNCNEAVIDQFVNKKKYYEYLEKLQVNENKLKIKFITHAENKYWAVACASIISRFFFLKAMKQLEEEYQQRLPLGSGKKVENVVKEIINNNEEEKAINFVKLHFITWKKYAKIKK